MVSKWGHKKKIMKQYTGFFYVASSWWSFLGVFIIQEESTGEEKK